MKEMRLVIFVLLGLFLMSFVFAEVSSSDSTNFIVQPTVNTYEDISAEQVKGESFWKAWNSFAKFLVVILVAIAFYLVYKIRKNKPKKVKKSSKKKVSTSRNVPQKKKGKKVVKKSKK